MCFCSNVFTELDIILSAHTKGTNPSSLFADSLRILMSSQYCPPRRQRDNGISSERLLR